MALSTLAIHLFIFCYSGGLVVLCMQDFDVNSDLEIEKRQLKWETIASNDNSTVSLKNAKRYDYDYPNEKKICQINNTWPIRIQDDNVHVEAPVFLGNYAYLDKFTYDLPEDQPSSCPPMYNSWWPGTDHNLKPNCPWRYRVISLGNNFYPSRILEASCLCSHCVNDSKRICSPIQQRVYVLTPAACEKGYYEMHSKWKVIVTACMCI